MSTSSSSSSRAHTRLSHVTSHLGIGIGIGIGIPVTSTSTSTLLQSHDTSALSLLPSKQSSLAKAGKESLMLERSLASFSVQSMTDVLFGSRATAQLWDRVSQQQERDAVFASDSYDLEPIHHREQVYARVKRMLDYKEIDDPETYEIRKQVASLIDSSLDIRLAVHYSLFAESVLLNGTTEQLAKWKEPILSYKLPGCFAMTELGHGSYVQGFETTATFDREKDEFIIHTPTDTATKWWIGGAAHSALVTVVYARLIIDKKDYGVYNFFVPLRRRDNFSCLPGVTVGDIGAKMGRHGIDNGWLQFTHVRIPRENMLMRWAKVDRNGKFEQSPSIQLSYGALIPARVGMAKTSVLHIKRALIIAIRYAAVRRQFPSADPTATGEQQLLDYATHMMRLMPLLAETYAIHFACKALDQHTRQVQAELAKGDARNLNDLHGLSAGMKAFTTWFAHEGIDTCRQSCGGHGYSAYTGLGMLSYDFAVNCTWEGDNTVMALQSARALVKSMNQALSGKKVTGVAAYLATYKETLASRATFTTAADLRRSTTQLHFLTYIATKLTHGVTQRMNAAIASGETSAAAWNNAGVSLRGAAKAHIYLYIARTFVDAIDQVHDENVRAVLHDLCDLFTIYHIRKALATLLEDGFISGEQSRLITSTLAQCCRSVRSQAIPLVDSFHYSDDLVRSPLGRYDGNVYEAFFLRVKNAPESQSRPFYWETFIKPNLYRHQQPKDPLEL